MKKFALFGLLALGACQATPDGATANVNAFNAKVQAAIAQVCAKDAQLQPMTAADMLVVGQLIAMVPAPQAQAANAAIGVGVAVDNAAIHPQVQKLCAAYAPPAPAVQ